MTEFFAWVGIIVVAFLVLAMLIPIIVGSVEFWMHWWQTLKALRQGRRDKKAGVR